MSQVTISDGDIYPNDGESFADNGAYYPDAPEEQKEEERAEVAVTAASYPIMASVAEWFKQEILDCDDITNIQFDEITVGKTTFNRKVSIEAQALAFMLLKERLQSKFEEFKEFTPEEES
jgi:hypothetical protein